MTARLLFLHDHGTVVVIEGILLALCKVFILKDEEAMDGAVLLVNHAILLLQSGFEPQLLLTQPTLQPK